MREADIPWSELRLVLAVQRSGTVRGAAKALRLSHPTVSRRIAELQEALGVHLFEREGRTLRLTAAGEDLAETAARIEVEVDGLSRRIAGRDHRLEGVVRVALSPTMFAALTPAVHEFTTRYPGIQLEFVTALTLASLTRREADVAIRFTDAPGDTLVGRKVSQFQQAVFARTDLMERLRAEGKREPSAWPWVDWDESHRHHASAWWIREHLDANAVVLRCDNSLTMQQLVRAGVAVGFCPTMLAGPDPALERLDVTHDFPVFNRGLWVLTHADLRNTGRVRATTDWLAELLRMDGGAVWPGIEPPGPRP